MVPKPVEEKKDDAPVMSAETKALLEKRRAERNSFMNKVKEAAESKDKKDVLKPTTSTPVAQTTPVTITQPASSGNNSEAAVNSKLLNEFDVE